MGKDIPLDATQRAKELIEAARDQDVGNGKPPATLAAGAFYVACKEAMENPPTQRDIAEVANVSGVTVRNSFQDIHKGLINGNQRS